MKECKYCNKSFDTMTGRVFSNHVKWCTDNPNRDNQIKNATESIKKHFINKNGIKTNFKKICKKCNREFTVNCLYKDINNKKLVTSYCSISCSKSRERTVNVINKIKNTLLSKNNLFYPYSTKCKSCGLYRIVTDNTNARRVTCSQQCRYDSRTKNFSEYKKYKHKSRFNFSLNTYPNEFDFKLIEIYGWYSASNKGNNLNGVSRDHIVSIKYGFKNNIPTEVISHPANCQLILQKDNSSKHIKNGMTVDELIEKIKIWDEKYK